MSMNWEAREVVAELGGALGVIASLPYVAARAGRPLIGAEFAMVVDGEIATFAAQPVAAAESHSSLRSARAAAGLHR
jgi:hypothetical protein